MLDSLRTFGRLGAFGLAALAGSGCAQPVRLVVVTSSVAQTVSMLGDTLYSLPLDGAGGPGRARRISEAREELARDSSSLNAWLRLGRSTVALGRLREAVGIYSEAAIIHFNDARVFRERGEVLLRLRHLDRAIGDFRKAGLLLIGSGPVLETPPPTDDGKQENPWTGLSTLQYQVPFYLGIALYCKGDYPGASLVLVEAAKAALTTDQVARAMLWLFFSERRIGDGSGGADVLALVDTAWAAHSRSNELSLLLGYKGTMSSDSIRRRGLAPPSEETAMYSYGIAYYLELQRDRREEAELWLERARSGSNWATLPYLVAEADLARLRGIKQVKVR